MNRAAPPPILELDDVSADRHPAAGPVRVVRGVSLTLVPGEFLTLMGPSGSGKTSVLQLASGLLAPASGVVRLDGAVMRSRDRQSWATARRRTIGMIHQRLDLLGGLSVIDNVALPLLLDGTGVRASLRAAVTALERLGAAELVTASPQELSVGQQQLVAVARSFVGERCVVLADEPTAALDTVAAERVVEVLADLATSGIGVLMATHDTRLGGWADRVEFLRDGVLVRDDSRPTSISQRGR